MANITAASRTALDFVCNDGSQIACLVETHLSVQKGQGVVRRLQGKGNKTWLSTPFPPAVDMAAPRGGVLITAKAYLQVRAAPLDTGLGRVVDEEIKRHAVSVQVRGVGVEHTLIALYVRPTIGVQGNWAVLDAFGCALRRQTRAWVVMGDWNCEPSALIDSGWVLGV